MLKKIAENSFKTIPIVLVALAMLSIGSTAWGQTRNPVASPLRLQATIMVTINGVSADRNVFVDVPCLHYESSNYPNGTWNGKFTTFGYPPQPLSNSDTSGLAYPLQGLISSLNMVVPVTADNGNAFWDAYYTPRGFTRIGAEPDLTQNCHGYSTGVGYWLNDIYTKLGYDYQTCHFAEYLANDVVYNYGRDHSGKVDLVTAVTVAGATRYTVVTISEKCRESAVYKKLLNRTFAANDLVIIEGNSIYYKEL
jgi:hypothetical protein